MLVLMPPLLESPVMRAIPDWAHCGRKAGDEWIVPPRAALFGPALEAQPSPFFACPPCRGARELGSHSRLQAINPTFLCTMNLGSIVMKSSTGHV